MDKSMEKIDSVKLLIYLLIFIVITLFMVLFLIVPNIKDYRASMGIYEGALVHKLRVESLLKDRQKELSDLSTENRRVITSFKHTFTTENFIAYSATFFNAVSLIEAEKQGYKDEFTEYQLRVSSQLKSPTAFYDFLEGLNRYENIIQADFPIHMESNSSTIQSSFTIKVYNINATK